MKRRFVSGDIRFASRITYLIEMEYNTCVLQDLSESTESIWLPPDNFAKHPFPAYCNVKNRLFACKDGEELW